VITREGAAIQTLEGQPLTPEVQTVPWDPVAAEKGEFRHFMHKEIHEQVRALTDTISGRVDFDTGHIRFRNLQLKTDFALGINKIFITACGTAAYAGMVGKILIEKLARIPVEISLGSEFRYADPIVSERDVVLAISQSGETADTLAALNQLSHVPLSRVGTLAFPASAQWAIYRFLKTFYQYHLEELGILKTLEVLKQMKMLAEETSMRENIS
jgi:glucosamine--fructose-6-phosphate aminotransferase (isomerizing)